MLRVNIGNLGLHRQALQQHVPAPGVTKVGHHKVPRHDEDPRPLSRGKFINAPPNHHVGVAEQILDVAGSRRAAEPARDKQPHIVSMLHP